MRYYPVNLDIKDRPCLVVGGGSVGTRKVINLLRCGAKITVVSPVLSERLQTLAAEGSIVIKPRVYQTADLEGVFLVIGATSDESTNRRISKDAEKLNMLCNIVDRPEVCNFILPAIIQRGDLVITVSTSGTSPAFAKKLRQTLEGQFGDEYGRLLQLMGAIRQKLLSVDHEPEAHKNLFEKLVNSDLLDLVREHKAADINALLGSVLGQGFRYEALMDTDSHRPPEK
ncbi:MAG: bifunctional precorrin-2 dehydrogenase/sirohydrochlorin ferrochelatase [Desulfobacterales bacterium]|nr:MAG: bifunctional precorrin-2 dehydrogenase/sirohydrochlorin ferrochelatase [Desulfobacterales bacterium]